MSINFGNSKPFFNSLERMNISAKDCFHSNKKTTLFKITLIKFRMMWSFYLNKKIIRDSPIKKSDWKICITN